MSLELQEREIKLMSSQARRERSVAEEAEAEAREKKYARGGKKGSKKVGKKGSKRRVVEQEQEQEQEENYLGVDQEIEEEGVSLMDKSWAFADGPAGASLDYGSRPGTSSGGGHGGSRGGGGDGISRGHTSSSRILPIDEEFGNGGGDTLLAIPVTEVDDDC